MSKVSWAIIGDGVRVESVPGAGEMAVAAMRNKLLASFPATLRQWEAEGRRMEVVETLTFDQWMDRVDVAVGQMIGCSVHDLVDQLFRDWFDSEMAPRQAAVLAIRDAV